MSKTYYIQNIHTASITANIRGADKRVTETIKFPCRRDDPATGRPVSTGYTAITGEQYKSLRETSRVFKCYAENENESARLLIVHETLPVELRTPHEALVEARGKEQQLLAEIAELKTEVEKYKAAAGEAQTRYQELQDASNNADALKPLNDKIAALEAENKELAEALDKVAGEQKAREFD